MTRFIHDKFAKDYLSELLSPIGAVNPGREVSSEVRQIDVYFTPTTATPEYITKLGILGKMATTSALFEPFRNPVTVTEIRGCLSKLLDVQGSIERQSKRDNSFYRELPKLWMLTPTASEALLNGFGAILDEKNWCSGIYFLGEYLRAAIVVIHQLPELPETLWLRILGKGRVQERAIASLSTLAVNDPLRINTLELVYQLQSNLRVNREQKLESEDEELIMAIAPLFQEQLAAAEQKGIEQGLLQGVQQGIEQGIEQGRIEGQRSILENFLRVRFGQLNDLILRAFVAPISTLPAVEFTMLLVQLSALSTDENSIHQARRLLAENALRMRFGQLDERVMNLIPNLLALSPDQLVILLSQLPELSANELLERLDGSLG
ncbi:MAG TPA: flagellar assembly protein H [Cyanobacteria bacterium UBA12227]|nr:flagellar assembly protein H [Cyanobacteria bacterium UBA12227]HAX85639.1 flagellar assembly protein H [Cyanobacteria bacterium UBA11370]HBY80456.1 flagellar assembly protein H [Cyanobacteria bacterium UBA11148]